MALAGRSSRTSGGRRFLIAALIVTILVVLLDASLKSRSPAPAQTLTAQAWVDRVLPVIASSTAEGRELAQVRTSGLGMPASQITGTLDGVASGAATAYRTVLSYGSPVAAGGAPGLLEAALLARSKAAGSLASAVTSVLAGAAPTSATDPSVTTVASAGDELQVADSAYALFSSSLPKSLGVTMPPSTWLSDPTQYQAPAVQVWLASLRNGTSLTPVYQLAVDSVSTNPPPVGIANGVQDVPPTASVSVTVVVADTGNQAARDLTVTVAVTPATARTATSVRGFVTLTPGTSTALTLGPLSPLSGSPATLTVTVAAPTGSPTPPATATVPIEVAAPPPPTTTSTPQTTTTVAHS